jgi:S1-C subfamily serine protease
MLKNIFYVITLLTVSTVSSAQQIKLSSLEKSVVQVGVLKQDKTFAGAGTGFFVRDDGLIATAFHVYGATVQLVVENRGGAISVQRTIRQAANFSTTEETVALVAADPLHDIALLKLAAYTKADQGQWEKVGGINSLLPYTATEIESGRDVTTIGYFGADAFPVTEKSVLVGATSIGTLEGAVDEFLVSALAVPGESGSPVVLGDGTVVGIVLSIVTFTAPFNSQALPSGLNRVAKAEFLQRLLSSVPK